MWEDLLKEWCHGLLRLQLHDTGDWKLDGGITCPSCGRIHGRCMEAMVPFLHMAAVEEKGPWLEAAKRLFIWAQHNVSQPEGFWFNDTDSEWKGTTVFMSIALADCLLLHGDLPDQETKRLWTERLFQAAEFLNGFEELNENNINYPVSNALALYECGLALKTDRYREKARTLAALAKERLTDEGLLFGEGIPQQKKSPRGCQSVDIGYNVEETLPSLALYGVLSGDEEALAAAERGLIAQLDFMLDQGAWDNSFGTRNFKWTYWGSRTSDGCALGYLLLANRHPSFAAAAMRNTELLSSCTWDGLLAGGPHYRHAGQKTCVHHTFTHAKVLAGILDRGYAGPDTFRNQEENQEENRKEGSLERLLPRQQARGIRHYPSVDTWLVHLQSMTATVTAYDWQYLPGGHVSGGTLSLLHHYGAGTLLCAGMTDYAREEPNNMQIPRDVRHECLALRIEVMMDGILYSSMYEEDAAVQVHGNQVEVSGQMKDRNHQPAAGKPLFYQFCYQFEENGLTVRAEFEEGCLICPVISRSDETVLYEEGKSMLQIMKNQTNVWWETDGTLELPYGTERIFNLVPGLQAVRIEVRPEHGKAGFRLQVGKEAAIG